MISKEQKLKFQEMRQERLNDEYLNACMSGDLDIVQYLLTSPELKKHADIHAYGSRGFACVCNRGKSQLAQFFIFDMNIEKTEYITQYFKYNPNEEIENMFILRELNQYLQVNLASENDIIKRGKI